VIDVKVTAPKGLGDAIYLRAIVLHLLASGLTVQVFTFWPLVFKGLPVTVTRADEITHLDDVRHAMACYHCRNPAVMAMDQFTRLCLQAGLGRTVDLRLDWTVSNHALVEAVKTEAAGRPILLYQPEKVSGNPDEKLLRPRRSTFARYIADRDDCFRVKIGHPRFTIPTDLPCEMDLYGKTSIRDVFDIAAVSDRIFGEAACYLPILAQAMDKPFTAMFSRRGMAAQHRKRVWAIRPELIFHKQHLATAVFDDKPN
jgi:hypothetical protein